MTYYHRELRVSLRTCQHNRNHTLARKVGVGMDHDLIPVPERQPSSSADFLAHLHGGMYEELPEHPELLATALADPDAAKVRADADAELADLREKLDAALEDRANADAAAEAASARRELAEEQLAHAEQLRILDTSYQEPLARDADTHTAELDRLRANAAAAQAAHDGELAECKNALSLAQREQETAVRERDEARVSAEREAAAAASAISRLDADLEAEKTATAAERERGDGARDALSAARVELAEARAQAAAARERADELRTELDQLRNMR